MVGDIGQPSHLHYDVLFLCTSGYFLWCMLGITLLLHMLYVLSFHYINMLMVRYYSYYTVVTYMIYVLWLVLDGNSSGAVTAI